MPGTRVVVEMGSKRVFASAVDWPGWCRAGKNEQSALEALALYAERYASVPAMADIPFPVKVRTDFEVIERLPGDATTDFGAPGATAKLETKPMTRGEVDRMCALVAAAWSVFDRVVAGAPAELRKGPRGGGRDRDKIVHHVLGAEAGYGYSVALKLRQPEIGDTRAISAIRDIWLETFRAGANGKPLKERGRPARYMARRIAWHTMDHAWEIEDRS